MLGLVRQNEMKKVYGTSKNVINFNKIMIVSCVRVDLNKFKLTYLINYVVKSNNVFSVLENSVLIDLEQFNTLSKYKFGVWYDHKILPLRNFVYSVYLNNDKLIYKHTKHSNSLSIGQYNSYGHKLIYKSLISNGFIVEDLRRCSYGTK